MANRPPALDPLVFSIRDLEHYGSVNLSDSFREYYNGGAMDMIT
jgi:(S)-2-hydroxy-acid oxidase